ncbi:pyrimidine 5'-nucleotidase [Erwinia tasmaniensis]|uniref:Nucleoside 5'-monophosphate phosphohydrolase n=1 Tax=Erwinia tasmaniensis (strain DSM 17950 / CFBP 7177 / CIP 109463 / NCPPB 4357 / Et1/99) TaxID=465817 RepID=B2VH76_ERWT9|nr:pyrimidine 5'-nucleotidase [Erwinia tasmaniensis]CAO95655.1 Nucleoside 5'-monophosphate phosphohydrolase [Erwinia tasmaniensis Et1/99]
MLKNWDWILFDADETLFHFDAFAGLQRLFQRYDISFTRADYDDYQAINKPLWVDYQNGAISALQLQHQRFEGWAAKLDVTPQDLNGGFLRAMAEICTPLPGAAELINALQGRVKIGIMTNGFTALQQARLEHTGFSGLFDLLVISEQVGYAKPHPAIFDYALGQMANPPRDRVLMVGDNPDSDILGGINAGMATCWLNSDGRSRPQGIKPDWEVTSLTELQGLLGA